MQSEGHLLNHDDRKQTISANSEKDTDNGDMQKIGGNDQLRISAEPCEGETPQHKAFTAR